MELLNLDSNFQPTTLVENYESLIWTERYAKAGDFQLVSSNISETIAALPEESYVTLRESTVPMMVEYHKIQKPLRGAPKITVYGRSFEACALERRGSVRNAPPAARSAWLEPAAKESDAAYKAMRQVIGDTARYQDAVLVLNVQAPAVALDVIPEIDLVLPADYSTLTPNTYEIKPGELYATVMELINTNHRGIKSTRPSSSGSQIGVEIYNGADLTNLYVVDARFDQFTDATYLLGKQGSKNVAYVYGSGASDQVLKTAAPEPTGLARRVLVMDESSDASTTSSDVRKTRGLIELYKHNAIAMFDGQVAEQIAADYNNAYFLGDIIKLTGEYGLSQNVRVAEFIRTSDATGNKAYPAFEAVTE